MTAPFPIAANGALYDPSLVEEYLGILFRNVDWDAGQTFSILGIGEKGTSQEGTFRDRHFIPPAFPGAAHEHLKRWACHHVAGFIVPAVLKPAALDKGDVTLDKVAALTAIILDIDSGDTEAKRAFVTSALGEPSLVVASGGFTDEGTPKLHLYWLLNEPSEEIERVAALRKALAAKCGGDQSFGRATQVVRVPGSVHAKNGIAALCSIVARSDCEYGLDDLADIITDMLPMVGLPVPVQPNLPALTLMGMDFTPKQDTAIAALHRDIDEGGTDLTRWGEFSKVAGFQISEMRAGRVSPEQAFINAHGWVLQHMAPPWHEARVRQEFAGLVNKDMENHGAMPAARVPWSNVANDVELPLIHFADIEAPLTNTWRVRDLLPEVGLAAIYGSPGAGKSFLALDVALRVAAGLSIEGRAVKQAPVVYIAAEGASGFKRRVVAWRRHHGFEGKELPFALIPCPVNLLDPHADLRRLIARIEREVSRLGARPGVIFVDTLAATFGGGDENTNAMGAYVNNLATLRDAFDALAVVVHHRPKDQLNDTLRGHGSLTGAMDTILRVEGTDIRTVSVTKQKDAEAGAPIAFRLVNLPLGIDEEGEPVGAGIVDYVTVSQDKPLSLAASAVLQALRDAIDEAQGAPVLEGVWRTRWNKGLPNEMKDDTRRKALVRAKVALHQSGRVQDEAGAWSIMPTSPSKPAVMDFTPTAKAA